MNCYKDGEKTESFFFNIHKIDVMQNRATAFSLAMVVGPVVSL